MAQYEALYGRKCRIPIGWFDDGENKLVGPELVQQATKKIKLIQERVVSVDDVQVTEQLSYEKTPIAILDRQVQRLRAKDVISMKVLWRNNNVEEMTWEDEKDMKSRYPHLFPLPEEDPTETSQP
ncbi:uncharacterized protein [Nicotiana tomentosiformis]|uniref:uncharacterized protein n=1 Tax=Nicotiana tomentosiformis TaxID=4098 RepID=UPI00388C6863